VYIIVFKFHKESASPVIRDCSNDAVLCGVVDSHLSFRQLVELLDIDIFKLQYYMSVLYSQ